MASKDERDELPRSSEPAVLQVGAAKE